MGVVKVNFKGEEFEFKDGVCVIVVIISCINILNLSVILVVGLVVKKVK